MCLLIVCSQVVDGFPLVVAANRDESFERPADAITLLQAVDPAILGGRDLLAGGTWLAVNEHGVVAGLTNRTAASGRDPSRRSRGELPFRAAQHASVDSAVGELAAGVRPSEYNSAWMLIADRDSVAYASIEGAPEVITEKLSPGVHILENRPLGVSNKVDRARELLGDVRGLKQDALISRLVDVVSDHDVGPEDPELHHAPCCVHGQNRGTRSSMIVLVPVENQPITVLVADGRPCTTRFIDESWRWPV